MGLHEDGYGFGVITKAYFFAEEIGMTPEELLEAAHGSGWGNVLKENGLHPGSSGNGGKNTDDEMSAQGGGKDKAKDVPPGQAKKQGDGFSDLAGPGGKDNNGQGNGSGKDKGKGVSGQSADDNGNGGGKDKGKQGGNGKGKGKK
jgi:hypothetical protein